MGPFVLHAKGKAAECSVGSVCVCVLGGTEAERVEKGYGGR